MGCQKEEAVYSCSDEINTWANEKKEFLETTTRKQLSTLPLNYQVSAFRASSNEKKASIWAEKLQKIKNKNYWTDEEKEHINTLTQLVRPEAYDVNNNSVIKDKIHKWEQIAFHKMNWDSTFVFFKFCTFSTKEVFFHANTKNTTTSKSRQSTYLQIETT